MKTEKQMAMAAAEFAERCNKWADDEENYTSYASENSHKVVAMYSNDEEQSSMAAEKKVPQNHPTNI